MTTSPPPAATGLTAPALPPRTPPGPPSRWPLGNLPEIIPGETRFRRVLAWQREYGDVFRVMLGTREEIVLLHPDHIQHVLVGHARNYPKSDLVHKLRTFLGNGLVTSEGDFWLRQRRMMQPHFHLKALAGLAEAMAQVAADVAADWRAHAQAGAEIEVTHEMMRLTLRVIGLTMLGADMGGRTARVGAAVEVLLREAAVKMLSVVDPPLWLPTPANRRFLEARRTVDEAVQAIVGERRAAGAGAGERGGDLLDMLLQAVDEDTGEGMTDQQLRDEVVTIFLAGHETTALALTWTWYLLSRHPLVERKLHAELDSVLGGRAPTLADLPSLVYTGMVLEEAMRLYPPVYYLGRQAADDDVVGGYHIPKGAMIGLNMFVTHRHPDFWDNPEGFDPERFEPSRAAGRHKFAYLPFGGGARVCIGSNFALMEAKIVLATLAQRYRLALRPEHPVAYDPIITLRPKHGMVMRVTPRTPAAGP